MSKRDEGLHEFQLRGKQLVFLFMTATIVAVAIFLSGVMVGRGVRLRQAAMAEARRDVMSDPTAMSHADLPAAVPSVVGAPLSSQEDLSYPDRLSGEDPTVEALTAATARPDDPEVVAPRRSARAAPPRSAGAGREVIGGSAEAGFVVQVAAVREQDDADTMARRLAAKGYPAFVSRSDDGPARFFRVRIGPYRIRRDAESVAARLLKEEQFKPWITR